MRNVTENVLYLQGWQLENVNTAESYTFGANATLAGMSNLSLDYGVNDFFVSLPDAGAILRLKRPDGVVIDEISYVGEDDAHNSFGQMSSLKVLQRTAYTIYAEGEAKGEYEAVGISEAEEPNPYAYTYTGIRSLGLKVYELKDHLGNVRATVSDVRMSMISSTGLINFHTDVLSMTDYYAFGMIMVGRSYQTDGYRYGFNGKENDNEVAGTGNAVDFGARMYDSRLGRWLSLDPLSYKQPDWSPYKAFLDNPVIFEDPDGKDEVLTIIIKKNGKTAVFQKITPNLVMTDGGHYRVNDDAKGNSYHFVNHYFDYRKTLTITINDNGKPNVEDKIEFGAKRYSENVWFGGDAEYTIKDITPNSVHLDNFFNKGGDKAKSGFVFMSSIGGGPSSSQTISDDKNPQYIDIADLQSLMSVALAISPGRPGGQLVDPAWALNIGGYLKDIVVTEKERQAKARCHDVYECKRHKGQFLEAKDTLSGDNHPPTKGGNWKLYKRSW